MQRVSRKYLLVIGMEFVRSNLLPIMGYLLTKGVGPEWIANLILVSTIFLTIGTSFKFVDFWWCYRWTITTDQIKLNSGVINKKGQAYNLKDVKAVLVTQTVFERMVDLYTLAIDFPQLSGRDKFKIVGLTAKQLQPLQQALNGGEQLPSPNSMDSTSAAPVVNIPTFKLTPPLIWQSVWMAPPVLAVLSLLLALVGWLSDSGVERLHIRLGFTTTDIALYLLSILLLCIVVRVFEYGNFKVERHANYLTLSNGFLALQTKQIPLKQLQNIVVSQNVLERLLGYGSVAVTVLGDNQRQAGVKKVLPFIKLVDLPQITNQLLPEFAVPELNVTPHYWPLLWGPVLVGLGLLTSFASWWYALPTGLLLAVLLFFNNVVASISKQVVHQGWLVQHHYIYDQTLVEWTNYHDMKLIGYQYTYLGYRLNKIKRLWLRGSK